MTHATPDNWCLAPTRRGGLCRRYRAGPSGRCWQHGGRWVHPLVERFLAGEDVIEIARDLALEKSRRERAAYVERLIRYHCKDLR